MPLRCMPSAKAYGRYTKQRSKPNSKDGLKYKSICFKTNELINPVKLPIAADPRNITKKR